MTSPQPLQGIPKASPATLKAAVGAGNSPARSLSNVLATRVRSTGPVQETSESPRICPTGTCRETYMPPSRRLVTIAELEPDGIARPMEHHTPAITQLDLHLGLMRFDR